MIPRRTTILILAIAPVLTGCNAGPDYATPPMSTPERWSVLGEAGATDAPAELARWWELFDDPQLDDLIGRAIASNHDLRIATARVREARAQWAAVRSDQFPTVDLNGSATRQRRSENVSSGIGGNSSDPSSSFGAAEPESNLYQAGFDASWELDFFGRVRRSVEAAAANADAALEDRRDVLVTLLAEVARHYVEIRSLQRRIEILNQNIQTQSDTVDLSTSKMEAGLVSELDVIQARAQLATTHSQRPPLERDLRRSLHALAVLLGEQPTALVDRLSNEQPVPLAPPSIPSGLPSDLLRRRPDIRRAERALAAATARIGAAEAEWFPRFALNGSIGLASDSMSNFFESGSRTYSFGPSVSWPVFDAGRIRANVQVQNARQEAALALYEQTILMGLADVEDSLVTLWKAQAARGSLDEAVRANRRSLELAGELYSRGLTDFLNVLEAQRAAQLADDDLARSDRDVGASAIALYKALGGGWESLEVTSQ